MKILFLVIACACATPVLAGADYRYDLSMPFYAGTVDNAGYVVTNCDKCVLTSADIVSWSLTQTNPAMGSGFGGATFTSSSMAKSAVDIQGGGFVASPTGLSFDFDPGKSYANVQFSSSSNSVQLTNSPNYLGVGAGAMQDCSGKAGVCAGSTYSGVEKLGNLASVAKVSAPELGASGMATMLTLLTASLALLTGRLRVTAPRPRR